MESYAEQFHIAKELIGQTIQDIFFYLERTDIDFTEQPNDYGKSLLNGIDIRTGNQLYSVGNRFTEMGYGLAMNIGSTLEKELVEDAKSPVLFITACIGQVVQEVNIYWMQNPFYGEKGLYPQEIEILTEKGYLLLSSIEVTNRIVGTEFTDELLVIDDPDKAKDLGLAGFSLPENKRLYFDNIDELHKHLNYNS